MKTFQILVVFFIMTSVGIIYANDFRNSFQYISPSPGAKLVSKETNIIFRPGEILAADKSDLISLARIEGSISGSHNYKALISDDQKTVILKPYEIFEPGETVTVTIGSSNETITNQQIGKVRFAFTISPKTIRLLDEMEILSLYCSELYPENNSEIGFTPDGNQPLDRDVSLPSDFPNRTVNIHDNPDSGYIFLNSFHGTSIPYIMILDNSGTPVYYKQIPSTGFDFKKQSNGFLTYFTFEYHHFYVMDLTYTVIDSFQCGNGYEENTDMHEFQMLDNGHVLLMAYDLQTVDMSEIVEGGDTAATVIGLIIQELDSAKNVVFQWRSWDHFEITDASNDINLLGSTIDYVHGNAIELDFDGNLLLSSRNLNEITKINRQTGDIIWRLGGKNNEFTFVNEPVEFYHQHDIRRLPNGNITLYDNGNLFIMQPSRAVEYQLDEERKIATLIWQYRNNPDIFASVMGNVQRLPNGGTLIGWGSARPNVTEVRPDGAKAFELTLETPFLSYRVFRFPWHGIAIVPYLLVESEADGVHLIFNKFGDTTIAQYYIYLGESPNPATVIDSTSETYYDMTGLSGGITYYFRVTALDYLHIESDYSNETAITWWLSYVPGDANGDGNVIGSDVTFSVNYFRGTGGNPPDSVWNFSTGSWLYAAADANGDCSYIGSDVTFMINYLRGGAYPEYCPETPPYGEE